MAPTNDTSLQLDIPVLLPDAPDAADARTGRLVAELRGYSASAQRDRTASLRQSRGANSAMRAMICLNVDTRCSTEIWWRYRPLYIQRIRPRELFGMEERALHEAWDAQQERFEEYYTEQTGVTAATSID